MGGDQAYTLVGQLRSAEVRCALVMTGQRLVLISIAVVVPAAVIWVARSPTVDVAPATDEPPVSDSQLSFERETIDEPEQQTAEVAGTLCERCKVGL